MYKLIAVLSVVIRNYVLPSPFNSFENGELYNWIATAILFPITYTMVGLIYERGSGPMLGSLLFLVFYIMNTGVLLLCGLFDFSILACVVIGILYLMLFISAILSRDRFGRRYF